MGDICNVELSVIVCTHNPDPKLIALCLRAISLQTLDPSRFELIVVDNNSTPPLDVERLSRLACHDVRLVRELRQGLVFARVGGIQAAKSDLFCFVDDDNLLAPDYLTKVLDISDAEPELGTWGGMCEGRFTRRVGYLQKPWLPFLGVRDMGYEPLTGSGQEWGPWEPIGAGICIRRPVAEGYVEYVEAGEVASLLGRKGKSLMSGEDSLLSRIADIYGYQCGYRPQLQLEHHITDGRLDWKYLMRLMEGHGRSYYQLLTINSFVDQPMTRKAARREIRKRFFHRLKTENFRTALGMMFWDKGYFAQVRDNHGLPQPVSLQNILGSEPRLR